MSPPLRLVSFSSVHFAALASWFSSQREVVQWGGASVCYPIDDLQLQTMVEQQVANPPTRLCWMAQVGEDLIGHAQLALDWRNGNARIARVVVSPERRSEGLGVAMLRLVLAEAFSIAQVERVELNVYTWNTPAIRAYERLGFTIEGVRRSSTRIGTERWDTAIMAVLRCHSAGGSYATRRGWTY